MMTLIGKNGTAKKYRIEGAAKHAADAPYTGFSASTDGDDLIITTGKREIGSVQEWVKSLNAKSAPAPAPAPAKTQGKRYIELHSKAVEQGLEHGKAWRATIDNVDRNSLHPSWEDEMICYVYPS